MGELWRRVSELIWRRPSLLLPVLVADLLGYLVNFGRTALFRAIVLSRVQYHSALGGAPLRATLSPGAAQRMQILLLVITWATYFLRMLLYGGALIATAALVRGYIARMQGPTAQIAPAIRRDAAGMLSLCLRALALYSLAALLLDWTGMALVKHGHTAVLATGWVDFGVGALLYAALAWLLAPMSVQVLTRRYPGPALRQHTQLFAFLLGLASLALGMFVAKNIRAAHAMAPVARFFLELTGSWIVAIPFAVLFVALGLMAADVQPLAKGDTAL